MTNHAWCRDIQRDEAVRAAEDGRQGPLPTLKEAISRAGQFATPEAPQGANCPERESGLRTERVTLEITHDANDTAKEWPWKNILAGDDVWGFWPEKGESVRVVEEVAIDAAWAERLTAERDAAIREREEARGERDKAIREREEFRRSFHWSEEAGTRLLAERNASFDDAEWLRRPDVIAALAAAGVTVTEANR